MIETEEREIGEWRYRVTQLPFPKGRRMLVRLSKLLGPSFASLLEGMGKVENPSIGDLSMDALASALRVFVMGIEEDDLDHVSDTFAEYTQFSKDGDKWLKLGGDQMSLHFAGGYDRFFKWLAFCLEVNYRSFLPESANIRDVFRAISKKAPLPSSSPSV